MHPHSALNGKGLSKTMLSKPATRVHLSGPAGINRSGERKTNACVAAMLSVNFDEASM